MHLKAISTPELKPTLVGSNGARVWGKVYGIVYTNDSGGESLSIMEVMDFHLSSS
jgi:hypothetical protein